MSGESSSEGGSENTVRDLFEKERESQSTSTVFKRPELVDPEAMIDESRIVGRDDQVERLIKYLMPAFEGRRPKNMILYGPSGTGKSLIIDTVANEAAALCEQEGINFGYITINCERIDTVDRAGYTLVKETADSVGVDPEITKTGISTAAKFDRLYELIDEHYDVVLFAIDEIDLLKKPYSPGEPEYSSLLYRLTRIGEQGITDAKCSVATLTNNPSFMEDLDSRAESSFNPRDIEFPDYDSNQLRAILSEREDAFRPGALTDDVIPLCAAFGAQNHGDARKAIELLQNAGEIADDRGSERVDEGHVRDAEEHVNKDRTERLIQGLSHQKKLTYYAVAATAEFGNVEKVPSKAAYEVYCWITEVIDADEITRQTFRKYVKELEVYNLLTVNKRGRGRGSGVRAEYSLTRPSNTVIMVLELESRLENVPKEQLQAVVNAQLKEAR